VSDKHLHIVSFDIPYPPNYGGVIDVYYKLAALKTAGVKIYLHCFEYDRKPAPELDDLCEKVNYYPRKTGLWAALTQRPYIVQSRRSEKLINRLIQDDYPILFEGLHSCYYLNDKRLKGRKKIYRESNIEHQYYFHLFKAEPNVLKKFYFIFASLKLLVYQKVLKDATMMLVVSQSDTDYLQKHFKSQRVIYLPSFHSNDGFSLKKGKGDYALYHGKLSVTENYRAAKYLVEKVFAHVDHKLIIAGMDPPRHLINLTKNFPNIELVVNPDDNAMFDLISNAQVNVLVTFQATGLKLKLLNTLYRGRFCLVNPEMVSGTGLNDLCEIADGAKALQDSINSIFKKDFDIAELDKRKQLLEKNYSNAANARKLVELIFS
jgi:predicted nucleic acid-binding protein